jgi:hypothetical protein
MWVKRRMGWFSLALAASALLVIARMLEADPRGFGTHTQLGLPRCGFLVLTGLPCPACGLTTAFAHMAQGELGHALHAHATGVLLFVITLASVPLSVWAGVRDLPLAETLARVRLARIGVALACIVLAHWCVRMLWMAAA